MKKLNDFIKNNKLDLKDTGSGLNSTCTILAGFSLYLDFRDPEEVIRSIRQKTSLEFNEEFRRVFEYAYVNSYEDFWETDEAKKQYIF